MAHPPLERPCERHEMQSYNERDQCGTQNRPVRRVQPFRASTNYRDFTNDTQHVESNSPIPWNGPSHLGITNNSPNAASAKRDTKIFATKTDDSPMSSEYGKTKSRAPI